MSVQPPLISVIIPACLDTPEKLAYFHEALTSADQQINVLHYEIVVCLDGSRLPDPPRTNVPIRWLFHRQSRGTGAARNTAAKAARGKYLLPLDADDTLAIDALETLLHQSDPKQFVYGDVELTGDRSGVYRLSPYTQAEALKLTGFAPVTALFTRAAWLQVGGWDETLTALEDTEFYLRLIEAGYTGKHIEQVILKYRKHSASRQSQAERGSDLSSLRQTIREKHKILYNEDDAMAECSTCPGKGTVMTGVSMPDPRLQNPIKLKYDGPMQGSFTEYSHRDPHIAYLIGGKGSEFEIDERDLPQFEGRTVYGNPEYRNLSALQAQFRTTANAQPEIVASAKLTIPTLQQLPHLEVMNYTQAKAAIDGIDNATDLHLLLAEEQALQEPRKTVIKHITDKLKRLETQP